MNKQIKNLNEIWELRCSKKKKKKKCDLCGGTGENYGTYPRVECEGCGGEGYI